MTLDKFTIKAQETVQAAIQLAQRNGQQTIEPVHLLAGLMDKARDVVGFLFQKLGINGQQIELICQQEMQHLARVQGGNPYLSNDTNKVLQKAEDIAHEMQDEYVSCEPILLALLMVNSTVSRILKDAGATEKDMRQAILELRQGQKVQSQSADDMHNLRARRQGRRRVLRCAQPRLDNRRVQAERRGGRGVPASRHGRPEWNARGSARGAANARSLRRRLFDGRRHPRPAALSRGLQKARRVLDG